MLNKNLVIFKGVQNGILIILDEKAPFEQIQKALLKKLKNAKSFFKDANTSISFKGRELSEDEESTLLNIVAKESGIDISFVTNINSEEEHNTSSSEQQINNQTQNNQPIQEYEKEINSIQNILENNLATITHFHKGSLRSGQSITFNGSVVVIGDVNPGSKIVAEGNIIVLGKLKGVVHAGCYGNKDCFICALHMMPTQLIIGDCLVPFPNDTNRDIVPEYAYIKNNQIFVDQLIR